MTYTYLRTVLRGLLLGLWLPALAFASTVTLEKTLEGVTLLTLAIIFILSSMSGATALLQRIDRELRTGATKTLPNPTIFVSAHMLGSWMAGTLAFLFAESQDMNDWLELGLVICASFAGAKFIESASERLLSKWLPSDASPKQSPPQ